MLRYFALGFLSVIISYTVTAQTESIHDEHDTHKSKTDIAGGNLNRVGLFSGMTLVPLHLSNGKDEYLAVPTYGLEYERVLKKWLAIGFLNEFELENYVIETESGESIERSYVYVGSIVATFQPVNHLFLFIGPGYEFKSDQNFEVLKVGIAYSIHMTREWNIVPEVFADRVSNLYTTITFGISIGRMF